MRDLFSFAIICGEGRFIIIIIKRRAKRLSLKTIKHLRYSLTKITKKQENQIERLPFKIRVRNCKDGLDKKRGRKSLYGPTKLKQSD